MNKLLAGLAAAGAVLVIAVPAASAGTAKCPNEGTAVGNVTATNTTCAVAAKVIHADEQGKAYSGFKCTSKAYQGGATVTCKKGVAKVRYQIAD